MGTLALVAVVAVVAAAGGYAVGARSPRRGRRVFVAGFLCGSLTTVLMRHRRVRRSALRRVVQVRARTGYAAFPMNSTPALIAARWRRIR